MGLTTYGAVTETYGASGDTYADSGGGGTSISTNGTTVTISTPGTVTIRDSGNNIVYSGGSGQVTLLPGSYTWTDDLGGSGSFSVSAGGNRMGGSGAIRRPPRTFLHGRN